jgi:hypothetical protein
MNLFTILVLLIFALAIPTLFAVWFFGIRPFIAKNGKTRITGACWGVSMWADWTTAREIGKETGHHSRAARAFLILWLVPGCALVAILIASNFH